MAFHSVLAHQMPSHNASDYINRKGNYTLHFQAAADYNYCFFVCVHIQWPESPIPICLLGNLAYQPLPYIRKEFTNRGKTEKKTFFWLPIVICQDGYRVHNWKT